MNSRLPLFLSLVSYLVVGNALAQEQVSIDSQVDRAKILIGDVVRYSLRVTHDASVTVTMPTPGSNLGQFELRDYQVLEPQKKEGKTLLGADYLISTFDTGEFEIPPLSVTYTVKGDTAQHLLKSEPIRIMVQSLNPSEAGDIRDIKPPLTPPRDWKAMLIRLSGLLLLIAAVAAAWWYIRQRRRGLGLLPERQTPPRPAHEVALAALEALLASDWLAAGKHKEWHSELADIIRRYVEGRYAIDAMEMTSFELLAALRSWGLEEKWLTRLRELLMICDMAKFAKYKPEVSESERLSATALDFVHATKLVMPESATPGSGSQAEGDAAAVPASGDGSAGQPAAMGLAAGRSSESLPPEAETIQAGPAADTASGPAAALNPEGEGR